MSTVDSRHTPTTAGIPNVACAVEGVARLATLPGHARFFGSGMEPTSKLIHRLLPHPKDGLLMAIRQMRRL